MWGRVRTASSPTALDAVQDRDLDCHPTDVHKRSMTRVVSPDGAYWAELDQDNILQPLQGLGISSTAAPNRFAVQRGRIVPLRQHMDVVLPSQRRTSDPSYHDMIPPRRSSRRYQLKARHRSSTAWRPASSVYSVSEGEPSPPATPPSPPSKLASTFHRGGLAAAQISPPSSPDSKVLKYRWKAGDVSPLEDDSDSSERQTSRDHRRDTLELPSQKSRVVSLPRFSKNDFQTKSGIASKPQGLRTAVKREWSQQIHTSPASESSEGQLTPEEPSFGVVTEVTSPANERVNATSPSFGQRMRLMGKAKPESILSRPPWNGASGRSATVLPMRDDLSVPPLSLPPKDSKKAGRGAGLVAPSFGSETKGSLVSGSAMRRLLPLASKQKAQKQSLSTPRIIGEPKLQTIEQAYPSPPHDGSPSPTAESFRIPPLVLQSQALSSNPPDPLHFPVNKIKRKPPPAPSLASPTSTVLPRQSNSSQSADNVAPAGEVPLALGDGAWVPPPSRFSITTYATSNTGTPRLSEDEDVPALPPFPPAASVMDRSRPLVGGRSRRPSPVEPIVIDMSSPYILSSDAPRPQKHDTVSQGQQPHHWSVNDVKFSDPRTSILSITKPLPLAPPEMSSHKDTVSTLNAQLRGLLHRKVNIETSIRQMTELMPQDHLLASEEVVRKREVEKLKVKNLQNELAEIQRREHELGLKLHRAYKRQDRDAEYEPTTLWVRRVAG